jgi:hypothetical protein
MQKYGVDIMDYPVLVEAEAIVPYAFKRWIVNGNLVESHELTPCEWILYR